MLFVWNRESSVTKHSERKKMRRHGRLLRVLLPHDCRETELSPIVTLRDLLDNQSDRAEQTRRQGLQVLHVLRREAFPIPVVQ